MKPLTCPHCGAELDMEATLTVRKEPGDAWRRIPLNDLELSCRAENCFRNEGLETAGEIADMSDRELLRVPNFGKKSLKEVRELLAYHQKAAGLNRNDDRI